MNFGFNKVAGAVLGTALGVMGVGIVADAIYAPPHDHEPGYVIAVAEPGAGGEEPTGPAVTEVAPIADRLQTANAGRVPTRRQVQDLPRLRERRAGQVDRSQSLGCGRRQRHPWGFRLLRRDARQGRGGNDLDL
jgi:hypothetical protein